MPNSSQLRSSVSTCTRDELVADARGDRRAVGRHVVVGGGERAVGPADLAAGQPQAVEGLRARDLVDEVQVDVDAGPGATSWAAQILSNSVRRLVMLAAAQAGGHDGQQDGLLRAGVLEVVGQVGVEGDAVAGVRARGARRRRRRTTRAALDERGLARAGLVHRRVAGAAGDGARARACGGVSSARWPGSGGVRTS